jgi:hypothetical protein
MSRFAIDKNFRDIRPMNDPLIKLTGIGISFIFPVQADLQRFTTRISLNKV